MREALQCIARVVIRTGKHTHPKTRDVKYEDTRIRDAGELAVLAFKLRRDATLLTRGRIIVGKMKPMSIAADLTNLRTVESSELRSRDAPDAPRKAPTQVWSFALLRRPY